LKPDTHLGVHQSYSFTTNELKKLSPRELQTPQGD